MTDENMLAMLKIDLGIMATAYDQRLGQYLQTAKEEIKREGVKNLSASSHIADANLVIQYAAWLWRKRDTGEGMPRMLRWQINCRLFDLGTE